MSKEAPDYLSKREQQIMEVIYSRGSATANQVMEGLADPPSNATVRKLLRILEEKGRLRHLEEQGVFRFEPVQPKKNVAKGAMKRLLTTFFNGSLTDAVAALIDSEDAKLTNEELDELQKLIDSRR